jgi:hypothetical protein
MVRRKLKIFYQFKIFGNPSRAPAAHAVFRNFSVDFRKEKSNIALCRIICFRTVEKPVFRLLIRFGTQVTKTYINGNGDGNADLIKIGLLSIREQYLQISLPRSKTKCWNVAIPNFQGPL